MERCLNSKKKYYRNIDLEYNLKKNKLHLQKGHSDEY